jgi:hypothetical protein
MTAPSLSATASTATCLSCYRWSVASLWPGKVDAEGDLASSRREHVFSYRGALHRARALSTSASTEVQQALATVVVGGLMRRPR